jgi:hypothetical protein
MLNGPLPKFHGTRDNLVYRREDGEWRIVHRHADWPPTEGEPLFPR